MTPAELHAEMLKGAGSIDELSNSMPRIGIEEKLFLANEKISLAMWVIGRLVVMLEEAPPHNHAPSAAPSGSALP